MHALKDCPKAQTVLSYDGLNRRILNFETTCGIDWLEHAMHFLDKHSFEDFLVVLWNIWNARNNSMFRGIDEDARIIWDRAKTLEGDF